MRFPMIKTLINLILAITVGVLEKIFILLYLLLPIGLFMFIMQMRDKNNKTTALNTFINENSEFQLVFPNYILITIEPNMLKTKVTKKIERLNKFFDKYKWCVFFILLLLICIILH